MLPLHQNAPLENKPWSVRRYGVAILAVFGLQIGLVWFLENRPLPARPPQSVPTQIHLAPEEWSRQGWEAHPLLRDAALIPLPSQQGFSGDAWLRFAPLPFTLADWPDSPRWLGLDPRDLGRTFQNTVARLSADPIRVADKSVPRLAADSLVIPDLLPPGQSQWEVQGELAGRKPPELPPLPSWPHSYILTNTVIQVAVLPDGAVFSASLLSSCGLPEADQYALTQARTVLFEPDPSVESGFLLPTPSLAFGLLLFHWHTEPPVSPPTSAPPPS